MGLKEDHKNSTHNVQAFYSTAHAGIQTFQANNILFLKP